MIYLYGLVDAKPDTVRLSLAGQSGLQGALDVVIASTWSLVFSDHRDPDVMPKRRLLLQHTKILETLLPVGTVLPARFGLLADDLDHAQNLIARCSDQIQEQFKTVSGCIEIGVRVAFDRHNALNQTLIENPAMASERDALARKGPEARYALTDFGGRLADLLDRRRGVAQRALLQHLIGLSRDHVLRAPEADNEVLRAEFMIDAEATKDFISAVAQASRTLTFAGDSEPEISVIGPAPMYNFVRLTLAADPAQERAA